MVKTQEFGTEEVTGKNDGVLLTLQADLKIRERYYRLYDDLEDSGSSIESLQLADGETKTLYLVAPASSDANFIPDDVATSGRYIVMVEMRVTNNKGVLAGLFVRAYLGNEGNSDTTADFAKRTPSSILRQGSTPGTQPREYGFVDANLVISDEFMSFLFTKLV